MSRRGGALTVFAVLLSLCVFAVGALALYHVMTSTPTTGESPTRESALEPKSFSEYDWTELSKVAGMIAEAPTDEEGERLADEWGVHVGDTRPLPLADGRQASLTVVGIRCDQRSDGEGLAGITLMTSPISSQPMNDSATNAGGWEASSLREWLSVDGAALLPADLAQSAVSVLKSTNNVGVSEDVASVFQTSDRLWLFSLSEVCGPVDLFATEYGDAVRDRTYYIDYTVYDEVLSAEGSQYPYFASAGVSCSSDPSGALAMKLGGSTTGWWYRSPYPAALQTDGGDTPYFYQVMESGYPSTVGQTDQPSGVVVGLCL